MFLWKVFLVSPEPKRCFNVKSSSYYFHMKTKILADSQICISVTLSSRRSIRVHEYLTGCILLLQVHVIRDGYRSSRPDVFLGKGVLKICSKFIGEHPCRSAISAKLQSDFIETAIRHGCSPVNLLHIFRTSFQQNTPGWLLLWVWIAYFYSHRCSVCV